MSNANEQSKAVIEAKLPYYQAYATGFGSAIALVAAILGFLQNFSNIKFVDTQSYLSMREIEDRYYLKSFVNSHYLDKTFVMSEYLKKEDVSTKLTNYIALDKLNAEYVPRAIFEELQRQKDVLDYSLNAIPTPFKTRKKMLSSSGELNDQQLGISISVKRFQSMSKNSYFAEIHLALPDSPLHRENMYSDEIEHCLWTFRKNNRDFELKLENFSPLIFSIREI